EVERAEGVLVAEQLETERAAHPELARPGEVPGPPGVGARRPAVEGLVALLAGVRGVVARTFAVLDLGVVGVAYPLAGGGRGLHLPPLGQDHHPGVVATGHQSYGHLHDGVED